MIGFAVGGLGVLIAIAVVVGMLVDRQSRTAAWVRIADARRINAEVRRSLELREMALSLREGELDRREKLLAEREERQQRRKGD